MLFANLNDVRKSTNIKTYPKKASATHSPVAEAMNAPDKAVNLGKNKVW